MDDLVVNNITKVKRHYIEYCDKNILEHNNNFICKLYTGNKQNLRDYCFDQEFAWENSTIYKYTLMHRYNCMRYGAFGKLDQPIDHCLEKYGWKYE